MEKLELHLPSWSRGNSILLAQIAFAKGSYVTTLHSNEGHEEFNSYFPSKMKLLATIQCYQLLIYTAMTKTSSAPCTSN